MNLEIPRTLKERTYKCKYCKLNIAHTPHGFRGHNYRETCDNCNAVEYTEYD